MARPLSQTVWKRSKKTFSSGNEMGLYQARVAITSLPMDVQDLWIDVVCIANGNVFGRRRGQLNR